MVERRTLSIVDWHADGSASSAFWAITVEQRAQVEAILGRSSDVNGLVTAAQAAEARAATSGWLSCTNDDSRL
ncbi:hypothetical protein R8Z50_09890 [Longispora sp. K20-0274]|uniref:hypothetical protein n=1 Tax=Longispora sp. K20-0274 TaxID=3088255 RepID=UPI003999F80E